MPDRPWRAAEMGATSRTVPDPATEPTIPVKRAAAVLGISIRHAYTAVDRGEIPSIRVGRSIVVPTAKFLAKYELRTAGDQTKAVA